MITDNDLREIQRFTVGGKEVFPPGKPDWVVSVAEMAAELLHHRDLARWRDADKEKSGVLEYVFVSDGADWCLGYWTGQYWFSRPRDVPVVRYWRPMFEMPQEVEG